jgi:hypothetical protein
VAEVAREKGKPAATGVWFGDEAGLVRRTRSPVAGPGAAAILQLLPISAPLLHLWRHLPKEGKVVGLILSWCDTAMY